MKSPFNLLVKPLSIVLALFIYCPNYAQGNKGSIKGTVKTADGQPATHVNVSLKNSDKGTVTGNNGEFEIKRVDAGSYILITSFIGLETREQQIEVRPGETTVVPEISLNENAHQLNEIVVREYKTNPFDRKQSDFVAKLPLKSIENPQVYNTISAELLKDQVITNFNDALKNSPGLDKRWESTGRGSDGAGYFSLRGFAVQPTMLNGLPGITNGSLDIANIERIEVIKGPSGTLFGSSLISYGGLINIVTKRPYDKFGGEITYNTGSFGLNRITADINTPLSKEKKVALRVNTAYHSENSFQDAGFKKTFFIAPSLSYEVSDRLSFVFNTEFFTSEGTNQTMLFLNRSTPLVAKNLDELNYNNKLSYTSDDVTIKNPTVTLQAQMNYKLSPQWTSQTVLSRGNTKSSGYYSYLWDFADGNATYGRYFNRQNSTTQTTDIQQNFIGDFKIGQLRNRIVAGLDYFHRDMKDNGTNYVLYDMITIQDGDATQLYKEALDTALSKAGISRYLTEGEIYSAYVSNVLNITPKLSAMVSLRLDHFNNKGAYDVSTNEISGDFKQTALSPKFGLVYQPLQDRLSVFANYLNGFTNVEPKQELNGGTPSSKTFKPEQANQWEVGLKSDFFDGKLAATLSYYDIRVSNVVRDVSISPDINYIQDGENYSKGFEVSVVASPLPGLNVITGYSFNDSEITATDSDDYRNRRPEGAGPQHLINAWLSYRLREGGLKGIGFAIGGNYSSSYATLNRASTGVFTLPAYTILNASLSYDTDEFRIALKLDNLTNEEYYNGWSTINPQKPRNLTASFAFKF
jgi:iron complex outermembrane receptor protein